MKSYPTEVVFTTCEYCGKRAYPSRNIARQARKKMIGDGIARSGHLNAYICSKGGSGWHLGNLSKAVIDGDAARDDYYLIPRQRQTERPITPTWEEPPMTDMHSTLSTDDINSVVGRLLGDGHHPSDVADAIMDGLLADLTTYRFIEQVPVNPALARRVLELNADNQRGHRQSLSDKYARDMSTGRWVARNGQPLNIATDGRIINGQHRLHGVVKSGRTISFDINMGIDPRAIVVIDAGAGRSAVDIIRTSGGTDLSGIAAVVRWVLMWEMGSPTGRGGRFAPTPQELLQRYEEDADLFNAAAARGGDAYARGLTTKAVAGTAYYLYARMNRSVADDLFDQIVSGLRMEGGEDGAAYRLRNRLFARSVKKLARHEQLALFVRAWNLYNTVKNGKRVKVEKLQVSSEGPLTNDNFPRLRQAAIG